MSRLCETAALWFVACLITAVSAQEKKPNSKASNSPATTPIENFLGISPDFKAFAVLSGGGVKLIDFETGKPVVSPTWDKDWGSPRSVVFAKDVIAVVTGTTAYSGSVRVFSLKSGELEQNIRGQISDAVLTGDGRFLAFTEFRPSKGFHLTIRDIQLKKTTAELRLGGNGSCALAAAGNHVAAHESSDDKTTIVEADTGKVATTFKSADFRKINENRLFRGRMPLSISSKGNLLACEAEDIVVLYDIANAKVAQKLEGHLDVIRAVAFSPNRDILASAAKDKTIRFWDLKNGKQIMILKNLPASELIFSADGKKIAIIDRGELSRAQGKAEIRDVESK
jgi:WD40 repeat protein